MASSLGTGTRGTADDKSDKLIYGFIHRIEPRLLPSNYSFPAAISKVIIAYYVLIEQFDTTQCGEQLVVTPISAQNLQFGWSNVYGTIIVDPPRFSDQILTWVFKIRAKSDPVLEIGILDANVIHKTNHNVNYFVEQSFNCYGIYLTSYSHIIDSHQEHSKVEYFGKIRIMPNSDHNVLKVSLNVNEKSLSYCMNDRDFGIALNAIDMSTKYILCASLMKQDISIEVEDFILTSSSSVL